MIDFENGKVIKLHRDSKPREKEVEALLVMGETVIGSYTSVRDCVIFTNKRIIAINKQGMTGTRRDLTSLPYKTVSVFSVETAGVLGYDSELELYYSGLGKVRFEFAGSCDIIDIGQAISKYALD